MTVRPRTKDFCIKYVICALFVEYNDVLKFLMLFIIFYIRVDSLSLLNIGGCYTKDNSKIFVGMYDDRIDAIILLLYYFMLHPRRAHFIIVDIIYAYWYKNLGSLLYSNSRRWPFIWMLSTADSSSSCCLTIFQTMNEILNCNINIFIATVLYIYLFRILYVVHNVLERGKLARIVR